MNANENEVEIIAEWYHVTTGPCDPPDGYLADAYFDEPCPLHFASEQIARTWWSAHYIGQDEFGIGLDFSVVPA